LNGRETVLLDQGEILFICRAGRKVAVNRIGHSGSLADSIQLISESDSGFVNLVNNQIANKNGDYGGDLTFSSSLGKLKIVNTIGMDDYIAGVVQAEGGYKGHPEYFKTQAVIARTYAYLHMGKHSDEGYDLCDDVHCQVYHGRSVTSIIDEAVKSTKDQVIADSDSALILTPFHSNCGGETVSSENVWLTSSPYLIAVFDPYCAFSQNAFWEKDIPRREWISYLAEKSGKNVNTFAELTFTQNSRMHFYRLEDIEVPLNVIRSDWNLRSTFFSITDNGDTLHLSGRGYGHGVGLCQEGAMVMATRGFTYTKILNFYYNKVFLMNIEDVKAIKKEDLSF
jgi:stage II sporulation protein D